MTLFTRCILHDGTNEDGIRISVMSRHTQNDGKTPDERITPEKFDEHLPKLAPSMKLLGDYYKRGLPWYLFEKRYMNELRTPEVAVLVRALAKKAITQNLTILCIEETPTHCHRRLLAEECQRYEPTLEIIHL